MTNTALRAENSNSRTITFKSKEHEKFYMEYLKKCRYQDVYHQALVYCLGIDRDTRENVNKIYNFKTGCVKTECLQEGWQTSGSLRIVRMAFNLYCNGTPSVGDYETEEDQLKECQCYTVEDLFCCGYARYFWEAIKIRYGYEAVSVSQIAGELGMTKGALYRHYESKRDIFDHIVKRMEQGDGEQAEEHDMPADKKENEPEQYEEISADNFMEYSKSMFSYWTENDFASSFRKMLTLEQFRNEEMQALYQQYLVSGPVEYVKDLFKSMEIVEEDKKATMFYSIMFFYYSLYDGAKDKTRIKEQFEKSISGLI